jgi:ubiquinone/menaquinone biosynthesis C-methylase UbiE
MSEYLLAQAPNEVERLQKWGRIWEPEAEAMLDQIRIQPGWCCLDLGCGPMGILSALSRRVGPTGQVVGADINPNQLAAARELTQREGLTNIEFVEADAFDTGLPRESFDLVHVRFVFTLLGRDQALMQELLALTRPGGVVVTQEADDCSYICYPPQPAWERLKALTAAAFERAGGDANAGRRMYRLVRNAGLEDVQARAAALALPAAHPYRRWPIESTMATRPRTREWGLISDSEWRQLVAECERIANDSEIFLISFMVIQTWGRKRARREG